MSYEEERHLSRELYGKYEFLRRIIELYAAGISWQGCNLVCRKRDDSAPEKVSEISTAEITDGAQNMLIDGISNFKLNIFGKPYSIKLLTPMEFPYEERGRPFLWPVTRNAKPLEMMMSSIGRLPQEAMEFVRSMLDDICSGLGIPYSFLVDDVRLMNAAMIKYALIVYRGNVSNFRNCVSNAIEDFAKQSIPEASGIDINASVDWNEEWFAGANEFGPVYHVFKSQGIDLTPLREEVLVTAKWALDNHYISRQTYDKKIKWFQ